MATPTRPPGKSEAKLSFSPTVQIAPNNSGEIDGYYYASNVVFYVQTKVGDEGDYVYYYTGEYWVSLPNNQEVRAQGAYPVPWRMIIPSGVQITLFIGPWS